MKSNKGLLEQILAATQMLLPSGLAASPGTIRHRFVRSFVDAVPGTVMQTPPNASQETSWERIPERTERQWINPLARQPFEDLCIGDVSIDAEVRESTRANAKRETSGRFLDGSLTNRAGMRAYKLYFPSGYGGEVLPLVVMLHGCKQNPDDFAAGTGMNRLADQHKFLAVYPAQIRKANSLNCWRWFNPAHQQRDRGEPSILADITRQIMREYPVDPGRVYVAGLSAGGSMAAILAAQYPELYAAVAIHSGLPAGAAYNLAEAIDAMKAGASARLTLFRQAVPAIVFHGDCDRRVHPVNGAYALSQCLSGAADAQRDRHLSSRTNIVQATGIRRAFTQTIFHDGADKSIAEHWVIHGSGHAWSGGNRAGSYTDPDGPDASAEMIRFFYANPRQTQFSHAQDSDCTIIRGSP